MKKFDGILLCTDLDGTLLNTDRAVSAENLKAIEYFKSEGGKFTFVTGRVPGGAKLVLDYVHPNVPIVCFNGAGIFDTEKDELIWGLHLDDEAIKVPEYVEKNTDVDTGIVVCLDNGVCFCRINKWVEAYHREEHLPYVKIDYKDIREPWTKVLFIVDSADIEKIRTLIANSEYADKYDYTQSSANYYELLPKNASKGTGLERLADILNVDKSKIITVGDNENDISMFRTAKVGAAVSNAAENVKAAADIVTVSNNEHAIAQIISDIENGKIKL